jgi:UDP:flavonoid glycosyltransferase YjiC (YdhE family)
MSPPRVALLTLGSRGDVEPFVRVACALQAAGADVLLLTHAPFAPLCAAAGVPFASLGEGMLEARASTPEGHALATAKGASAMMAAARAFMGAVGVGYWRAAKEALTAFGPSVAVLNTLSFYYHSSLCEALACRFCVAHCAPLVPTGEFSPPLGVPTTPFRWLNRALWRLSTKMGWAMVYRDTVDALRAQEGLPALPDAAGPYSHYCTPSRTVLLLHSPLLSPRAPDYSPATHVLGAPAAADDAAFEPSAELAAFVAAAHAASAALVLVTLGSMTEVQDDGGSARGGRGAAAVLRVCADAVSAAGARAIVMTHGATGADAALEGSGALALPGSVPHAWLLARCAAFVCHGGAGSVHAALRAGVPTVVLSVEAASDQAFWGARLVAHKLAPASFTAAKVGAKQLTAALRLCLEDAPLRKRCADAAVAAKTEGDDAAAAAARIILTDAAAV